ncbi:MAG: hypothetical protein IJ849_08905 [Selenomonadaceae bacterium]|nr:hypothetical protein [Selenomonadaceae bacterium]
MNTHRLVITLNRLGKLPLTRDEEVSLLWRLLRGWEEERHDNSVKYYCWNMTGAEGTPLYSLVFSAVDTKITAAVWQAAEGLKAKGSGIEVVGGSVWTILSVMPVEDFPYLGEAVSLISTSGMLSHRKQRREGRRSYQTFFLNNPASVGEWIKQMQQRLARRTNDFFGTDYAPEDVLIDKAKHIATETVMYKGGKRLAQFVRLKIRAPREVLVMAIYGGIGTSTGSGFGMVTIC